MRSRTRRRREQRARAIRARRRRVERRPHERRRRELRAQHAEGWISRLPQGCSRFHGAWRASSFSAR
eukprot:5728551-Prymnesium_polylepis.1